MTTSINLFWEKLQQANLVQGTNPKQDALHSPWFVKLLLAISGWLGAIFLLGFILLAVHSLLEEPITAFTMSLPLFATAYLILRAPNNEFYEHLALALSLAGQGLFVLSIFEWDAVELIWLCVGMLQALLVYFIPSFLHRIFSTIIATLCIAIGLCNYGALHFVASIIIFPSVWLCLHEFVFTQQYKRIKGLMYGLIISMVILNCSHIFNSDLGTLFFSTSDIKIHIPVWLSHITYVVAMVFTSWQLLSSTKVNINKPLFKRLLFFTFLFAMATFKAPGIGVGLVVLLLGFAHKNRVLFGLGVISLLTYCSAYYYLMAETLLFKSGVLFLVSALLLFSRLFFNKTITSLKDK